MTSMGHQVGLFDVMAELPRYQPGDRHGGRLAGALRPGMAGRDGPRRRVDHDAPGLAPTGCPPEHSALLTRAAGPRNLAHRAAAGRPAGRASRTSRRSVPQWRRRPLQRIPALHAADGRGLRERPRGHPDRPGSCPWYPVGPSGFRPESTWPTSGAGRDRAMNLMAAAFPESRFTGVRHFRGRHRQAPATATPPALTDVRFVIRDVGSRMSARVSK